MYAAQQVVRLAVIRRGSLCHLVSDSLVEQAGARMGDVLSAGGRKTCAESPIVTDAIWLAQNRLSSGSWQ